MTRINLIDPKLLHDKHLLAEYRELPRVYGLVRDAVARGERPNDPRNPTQFRMGPGHVRFFYPRLGWVTERFNLLVMECLRRGWKIQHLTPPDHGLPKEWYGHWTPNHWDTAISAHRIHERRPT